MPDTNGNHAAGIQVLRLLDDHGRDHSPENYEFAHRFLFKTDSTLQGEIDRITYGGIRINPNEAIDIPAIPLTIANSEKDVTSRLDILAMHVVKLIDSAGSATSDLGDAAASFLDPDTPNVRLIVAAMIARTMRAESSLFDAIQQAQTLQHELTAAHYVASKDHLTGLLSRSAMEELLLIATSSPNDCAIAFVDVDRFKSINDTHGHDVGDRVLKLVASTLTEVCSPHLVARWGGEEFLVLMEDTTVTKAGAIVDDARARLAEQRMKLREDDAPLGVISFSAGVSSSQGKTVAELIGMADALLYQAKSAGRNHVEVEPASVKEQQR